jgi:hypothetical protein
MNSTESIADVRQGSNHILRLRDTATVFLFDGRFVGPARWWDTEMCTDVIRLLVPQPPQLPA